MLSVQTQLESLFNLFSDRMSVLPHKHTVLLGALLVRIRCRRCTALSICHAYKLALAVLHLPARARPPLPKTPVVINSRLCYSPLWHRARA